MKLVVADKVEALNGLLAAVTAEMWLVLRFNSMLLTSVSINAQGRGCYLNEGLIHPEAIVAMKVIVRPADIT